MQYSQKVQQNTEVSQQQYMNVDVPAEMQCPEMQCQNTVKDAETQRQVQMIHKMPSDIHSKVDARFQRSSGAIARSSVADHEQTTDDLEMRERKR